jgi:hypothetical protein
MANIGIIVDGEGDYAAIKKRFSSFTVLKTDGPRGHDTTPDKIAVSSKKQVSMLKALSCRKAIVLVDYEGRRTTYKRFFDTLHDLYSNVTFDLPVEVAIPNRMIENWYLADIEYISAKKKYLKKKIKQKKFEGKHGKRELKKCFVKNVTYRETKHGPELFYILRFNVARKNSPSFEEFLKLIK